MRRKEDISITIAFWWNELVACKFKQLSVGISEIDRVHKAPINVPCVPDPALIQPFGSLGINGTRYSQGKMMKITDALWIGRQNIYPSRSAEERHAPLCACFEVT